MRDHSVVEGECLHQIAKEYGFCWETLWNHPDNAELKRTHEDPEVLPAGVVVRIPDLKEKTERCVTNKAHVFRTRGPAVCYAFDVSADAEGPPILEVTDDAESPDIIDSDCEIENPDTVISRPETAEAAG